MELQIPASFHAGNRKKLVERMRNELKDLKPQSICLFVGVPTIPIDDTDVDQ